MFDSPFPFRYINSCPKKVPGSEDIMVEYNYSFKGKNGKRYIVIVEEYNYQCFALKFCLQDHKNFHDRFSRLTHQYECSRVITTIVTIIKEIHQKNPFANFAFIGAQGLEEKDYNQTKRYKIYTKVLEKIIGPVFFERRYNPNNSSCIFISRDNTNEEISVLIEQMFRKYYPDLFSYEG